MIKFATALTALLLLATPALAKNKCERPDFAFGNQVKVAKQYGWSVHRLTKLQLASALEFYNGMDDGDTLDPKEAVRGIVAEKDESPYAIVAFFDKNGCGVGKGLYVSGERLAQIMGQPS